MNFRDSIKGLIENLVSSTISGRLIWQLSKYTKSSLEVNVDDFKFTFNATWRIELDSGYSLSKSWITIKSQTTDFDFTVYHHNFPELMDTLQVFLYEEYYSKNKPCIESLIDKIEDVSKKVSLDEYRDQKLNQVLK